MQEERKRLVQIIYAGAHIRTSVSCGNLMLLNRSEDTGSFNNNCSIGDNDNQANNNGNGNVWRLHQKRKLKRSMHSLGQSRTVLSLSSVARRNI